MVINPQFKVASSFSEGPAKVEIGGPQGYIDIAKEVVINLQFSGGENSFDGLAMVVVDSGIGYVDRPDEYIWGPSR